MGIPVEQMPPPPATKTNVMAIISLVVGIVGSAWHVRAVFIPGTFGYVCLGLSVLLAIIAIVTGFVGMSQVGKTGEKGRGHGHRRPYLGPGRPPGGLPCRRRPCHGGIPGQPRQYPLAIAVGYQQRTIRPNAVIRTNLAKGGRVSCRPFGLILPIPFHSSMLVAGSG